MKTPADVFPLMVPCSEDGSAWEGFLTLPGAGSLCSALWLRMCHLPCAASGAQKTLQGAQLQCSPELVDLLEVLGPHFGPASRAAGTRHLHAEDHTP